MRWLNQFISDNKKKKKEKDREKNSTDYYDYLKTLSLDEINVLYSKTKAALSIKKSIRNILVGSLFLSFMSSVVIAIKKFMDLYGASISGRLNKDVASIFSPVSILVVLLAVIFFSFFLIIVATYYKDTKKMEEQVSLLEIVMSNKKEEKSKGKTSKKMK